MSRLSGRLSYSLFLILTLPVVETMNTYMIIRRQAVISSPRYYSSLGDTLNLTCSTEEDVSQCHWHKSADPTKTTWTLAFSYYFDYNISTYPKLTSYSYNGYSGFRSNNCGIFIKSVTAIDFSAWRCTLWKNWEIFEGIIDIIKVKIPDSPVIEPTFFTNLVDDSSKGTTRNITCLCTSGLPPPTFSWFIDTTFLKDNQDDVLLYDIPNGKVLTYRFTYKDNFKKLTCVAHHRGFTDTGIKKISSDIVVYYKPRCVTICVNGNIVHVEVEKNTKTILSLNISSNPPPTSVQWSIGGENILVNQLNKIVKSRMTNVDSTIWLVELNIKKFTEELQNNITLKVGNIHGIAVFRFNIFLVSRHTTMTTSKLSSKTTKRYSTRDIFPKKMSVNGLTEFLIPTSTMPSTASEMFVSRHTININVTTTSDLHSSVGATDWTTADYPSDSESPFSVYLVLIIFGVCMALMIMSFTVYLKGWPSVTIKVALSETELNEFTNGLDLETWQNKKFLEEALTLPYAIEYELDRDNVIIDKDKMLRDGYFGLTFKGRLVRENRLVAVKLVQSNSYSITLKMLLSEIKILIHVGNHPHVDSIIGAHTSQIRNGMAFFVTDLCVNGSLENYLRTHSNKILCQSTKDSLHPKRMEQLMMWSYHIASGMDHIASNKIIHADLATKNVLLDTQLNAKITDIGLSRHSFEYENYVENNEVPTPWRWMAPESLTNLIFSSKTDVWAFGVTVWEIFSLGMLPYSDIPSPTNFVQKLEEGVRLPMPHLATSILYYEMMLCWIENSDARPTFTELKTTFKKMYMDCIEASTLLSSNSR